jgi:hypothetical protein
MNARLAPNNRSPDALVRLHVIGALPDTSAVHGLT